MTGKESHRNIIIVLCNSSLICFGLITSCFERPFPIMFIYWVVTQSYIYFLSAQPRLVLDFWTEKGHLLTAARLSDFFFACTPCVMSQSWQHFVHLLLYVQNGGLSTFLDIRVGVARCEQLKATVIHWVISPVHPCPAEETIEAISKAIEWR